MAINLTASGKRLDLVYSRDPDVKLTAKAAERLTNGEDGPSRAWVPLSDVDASDGATRATIRCLDFLEAQQVDAIEGAAEQIMSAVKLGLLEIDGSEEKAKEFLENPSAAPVIPLYAAIMEESWGN